jgi:hypothetical protein
VFGLGNLPVTGVTDWRALVCCFDAVVSTGCGAPWGLCCMASFTCAGTSCGTASTRCGSTPHCRYGSGDDVTALILCLSVLFSLPSFWKLWTTRCVSIPQETPTKGTQAGTYIGLLIALPILYCFCRWVNGRVWKSRLAADPSKTVTSSSSVVQVNPTTIPQPVQPF